MKCQECAEWEYFEGYGYGCFCRKRTIPLDKAEEECEDFSPKNRTNIRSDEE